jgi:hypothetical protein
MLLVFALIILLFILFQHFLFCNYPTDEFVMLTVAVKGTATATVALEQSRNKTLMCKHHENKVCFILLLIHILYKNKNIKPNGF